jgi:pyridoxine 5'-phosphate synthase PdxJ
MILFYIGGKDTMKKDTLTLDINNLLCSKQVTISKDEIIKITLFAIQNKLVNIMVHQNNNTEHSTDADTEIVAEMLKDTINIKYPVYGDITILPNLLD